VKNLKTVISTKSKRAVIISATFFANHFIFILTNRTTKKIVAVTECMDILFDIFILILKKS